MVSRTLVFGNVASDCPFPPSAGPMQKAAAIFGIEQSRKYRFGVKARQTTPYDLSVTVDQRRKLTVSDHSQVLDLHG